ncbi:MAG: MATE family efflux transporter [Erysipelotrichaceae bacterium]|nr:MATE family efflux transporter [Erysipelotrichaceae bacterium]
MFIESIFDPTKKLKKELIKGEIPPLNTLYLKTAKIAWPSAVEAILVALVGAIDMMMVGSIGKEAISAVGICNQPKYLCLAPIFAINTASIVLIARRKGQGRQKDANDYLKVALIWTLLISLFFCSLGYAFAREILLFAGAQPDYIDTAVVYFRIVLSSLVLYSIGYTMSASQRGAGYTKIAMITNLTANAVNIVFNAILINGLFGFPRLGVKGAAIATAIGNVVSFVVALISLLNKDRYLRLDFGPIERFRSKCRKFFDIFRSAFGEQIILRLGFFTYAKVVASLGTAEFAAHQVCMNLMSITFSFGDGLQAANTSLVGQSMGAERSDLAIIYSRISQTIGMCFAVILSLNIALFSRAIVSVFTQDPQVIALTDIPMKIMALTVLFQIPQVITIGALRGAGDVRFVTMMMTICVGIIRPGISYILVYPLGLGLTGAWLGCIIDQICRFSYSLIRFRKGSWTNIKV